MTATVLQDQGTYDTLADTQAAIDLAEMLFHGVVSGDPDARTTFSVEDGDGRVIASFTNRRIEADMTCQAWGGRKGDDAIHVKDETLDVTDYVLSRPYDAFIRIEDGHESSDEIGRAHLDWAGPCEVSVVDSICEYFGALSLNSISQPAFEAARARLNPQPPVKRRVTLSATVSLLARPDIDLDAIAAGLECTIRSTVPGLVVEGHNVKLAGERS